MSARISLYSDLLQFVDTDGVGKSKDTIGAGVFITFEGDKTPRGFRGSAIADSWTITARFGPENFAGAQSLLDLFESAFNAADGRLQIDLGGYDASEPFVCEVHSWTRNVVQPAGYTLIDFEAQEVRG